VVDVTGCSYQNLALALSLHIRPEAETKAHQFFVEDADVKGA